MEELKPIDSEQIEFESRAESIILALLGICGPSGFWGKEKNEQFFNRTVCYMLKFFDWDLDGRNGASSPQEKRSKTEILQN